MKMSAVQLKKAKEFLEEPLHSVYGMRKVNGEKYGVEFENELPEAPLDDRTMEKVVYNTSFSIKNDGSLRLHGYEFVSKPQEYQEMKDEIAKVCALVKDMPWTYSRRTSTHIHMNFSDKTAYEVLKFACTYWIIEPLLFMAVDPVRRSNSFCVSSSDTKWQLRQAFEKFDLARVFLEDQAKYASLNLCPLLNIQTVECRIFHSSWNVNEIHGWLDILHNMRHFAAIRQLDQIKSDFMDLKPEAFCQLVIGQKATGELKKAAADGGANLDDLLREGYNAIRPLLGLSKKIKEVQGFFEEARQEYERRKNLPPKPPRDDDPLAQLQWLEEDAKFAELRNLFEPPPPPDAQPAWRMFDLANGLWVEVQPPGPNPAPAAHAVFDEAAEVLENVWNVIDDIDDDEVDPR